MPPHWQPPVQLRVAGLVRVLVSAGDRTGALELTGRLDRAARFGIELRLPFLDAAVEAHLAAGARWPRRRLRPAAGPGRSAAADPACP